MKEIKIKIYQWSDLKKWFWDTLCFPRRKLVAEWLDYYCCEERSLVEEFLLKYNKKDLKKDDYAYATLTCEEGGELPIIEEVKD